MHTPQNILKKLALPDFSPLWPFHKGMAQTLAAHFYPDHPFFRQHKEHMVPLPDGDQLLLIENDPPRWVPSQRIILVVHGLEGSASSSYCIRAARYLRAAGFKVARLNLRGCDPNQSLAKKLYHSGRSDDTREVLKWLAKQYPKSPVSQLGFSLGANITLKMAGEDSKKPSGNLDSILAISSPLNLMESVKLLLKKQNRVFNDFFVKSLLARVARLETQFPDLPKHDFPLIRTVYEFDDCYTAPVNGFASAKDFYTRCSSEQFIASIEIPSLLLYALDDPLITRRPFLKLPTKANLDMVFTERGGHMGWLGLNHHPWSLRWMDRLILKWLQWQDTKG